MHIHKPKPLHSVREFLAEIGVIVVGVLIALGLEQAIESLHGRHRVEQAEVLLRLEARADASFATQYEILRPCADAYLDRLQSDLLKHDAADLVRLYEFGAPIRSAGWKVAAWESAVASQIGDHMQTDRYLEYADTFREANLLRDIQFRLRDDYAMAITGRHGLPPDTKTLADELAAVERLRTNIKVGRAVSRGIKEYTGRWGLAPDPDEVATLQTRAKDCLALLAESPK